MKIKISHILHILSPNILFLREGLHLIVHQFFVVSGENFICQWIPSHQNSSRGKEMSSICLFFLKLPCSSLGTKFPIETKPSQGQLQNVKCDWYSVICTKFLKSLTQHLWETWTMLELHKEITQMTNMIINMPVLLIIYLLNIYTETIIFWIPESLYCIISFDEWAELETHATFQWEVQENLMECSRIESKLRI